MRKMKIWKKTLCLILSLFFLMQINPAEVFASEYWPEGPDTESPAVILMELSTGTILYEKNSTEVHYPASITKILTVLVALENSDLDEIVTFSDRAIDETYGSGIARDYGEQMTMEQCLYGAMLASSNECAFAIAEHVGGTMEAFVEMMNEKAAELGCINTHFTNPHGLHDDDHYTCAYDMALIAQAAFENETFRIITGTKTYTIPPTNKHEEETPLLNHNNMLYPYTSTKYLYDYCVGGKTGYTDAANSTLVTYAEKDGMTLVCVVMNAQSPSQWTDSINLFDYAFDNFQLLNVADNETEYEGSDVVETGALNDNGPFVEIDDTAGIVIPKTAEFSDATSEITYNDEDYDVVATISYTYAGHEVGSADIIKTGVEIVGFVFDNLEEEDTEEEEIVSTVQIKPLTIVLILSGIVLVVILILLIKRVMDNYYIIRHNMDVRRNRREQFKRIKKKRSRWRRRR